MAATISEYYLSRKFTLGQSAGRELVYDIMGTADEVAVQTLLLATVPPVYGGLTIEEVQVEPIEVDSISGEGIWKGYARYVRFDGDNEYTFDTGGGTSKITQSLDTLSTYSATGFPAPDFEGAIGVTDDRVEGADITVPAFQFSETHRIADVDMTTTYKQILFNMTGRVNDASFKGLAAGECLFLGASGSKRGDEKWAITYRFVGSPNTSSLTLGALPPITKRGWDYLWLLYADYEDSAGVSIVKRPIAAYVEKVYEDGDFSTLAIGT